MDRLRNEILTDIGALHRFAGFITAIWSFQAGRAVRVKTEAPRSEEDQRKAEDEDRRDLEPEGELHGDAFYHGLESRAMSGPGDLFELEI